MCKTTGRQVLTERLLLLQLLARTGRGAPWELTLGQLEERFYRFFVPGLTAAKVMVIGPVKSGQCRLLPVVSFRLLPYRGSLRLRSITPNRTEQICVLFRPCSSAVFWLQMATTDHCRDNKTVSSTFVNTPGHWPIHLATGETPEQSIPVT